MKLTFEIVHRGEPSAGINAYDEQVTVEVQYGFGKDDILRTEFAEHMRQALLDFYDGAHVWLSDVSESKKPQSVCSTLMASYGWKSKYTVVDSILDAAAQEQAAFEAMRDSQLERQGSWDLSPHYL